MDEHVVVQAREDFSRARGLEMLTRMQFLMHPEKDKLLSFTDVKHIIRPKGQAYLGMRIVPIRLIVGS